MASEEIDTATVGIEPLIVIPFGLRLSSQDAAHALRQLCSSAWSDILLEVCTEVLTLLWSLLNACYAVPLASLERGLSTGRFAMRRRYSGLLHVWATQSCRQCESMHLISMAWRLAGHLRRGRTEEGNPAGHCNGVRAQQGRGVAVCALPAAAAGGGPLPLDEA